MLDVLRVLIFVGLLAIPTIALAQPPAVDLPTLASQQQEAGTSFYQAVGKAARNRLQNGEMSRREFIRLRVAMLSPSFRARAQELAVIQMVFSEAEQVPMTADGQVDTAQIDWDAIIAFLEKLIPILLELLDIFGAEATIGELI